MPACATSGLAIAGEGATRPVPVTRPSALWATMQLASRRLLRLATGTHALALADQAVVSGASFLTMIMIGRWTGSRELGLYAIGMSVLSSVIAIQDSLIALPYAIQKHRLQGSAETRAGNALAHNYLLSALAAIIIIATAIGLMLGDVAPQAVMLAWALAAAAPFVLLREFGRRFAFAHLYMGKALALDAGVAAFQLGLLGWLQWNSMMSAVTALGAIAAACGLTSVLWLFLARSSFSVRRRPAQTAIEESWGLGKWLFASILAVQVQWYVTYWLSVAILGAAAAGVYAACMSVVSFANPLITGLGNILTPRAVLARKNAGVLGLRRQAKLDALFIGVSMGAFSILIFLGGDWIMHVLYPRQEYQGYGSTTGVLALALLAQAVGTPASSALASMERPKAIFLVSSVGASVTVALVWTLMLKYSLFGAALGFLTGNMVGSAGRWVAFLAFVRRYPPEPSAAPQTNALRVNALRVIQQLTRCAEATDYAVIRLGEGDHATVVAVRASDARPVWKAQETLVLKLFKPEAGLSAEAVDQQFETVLKLHTALNGHSIEGWKITAPEPLFLCVAPAALVMTMVPGRDLNAWTAKGTDLAPETLKTAARIVVGGLMEGWKRGRMHGDLALQNILCDFDAKVISFIDGGTHDHCGTCHNNTHGWSPAVLDLAHMLSDIATDVKRTIGNKGARLRRNMFMHSALQAFLAADISREGKLRQLGEIQTCARVHVEELLPRPVSPRGVWQAIVKHVALRRMEVMFASLKAEIKASEEMLSGFGARAQNMERP